MKGNLNMEPKLPVNPGVNPEFLSLPIRRALQGMSWASLTIRWIPTEEQKQQRRHEEIDPFWRREARPENTRPEKRLPLHPLGIRQFPFERFYSRLGRAERIQWRVGRCAPRGRHGMNSPSAS